MPPYIGDFLTLPLKARTEPEVGSRTIPAYSQDEQPRLVELDDNELTRDLLDLRKSKYYIPPLCRA
jgi:hypothetical protein